MRRFLRVAGVTVGVLAFIVVAAYCIGLGLPRDHVASASTLIDAPPAAVAQRIGDPTGYDAWRDTRTEVLSRRAGAIFYREHAMGNSVDYRIDRAPDGQRFRSTILSEDLPFGGSWTISVSPAGAGSRVTVAENGFVRSPLWRFAARYLFGETMAIDGYLSELKASFEGEAGAR